jgi:hypothetical protein
MKKLLVSSFVLAVAASMGLTSAPAVGAGNIAGSVSVAGFIDAINLPSSGSIVSQLTAIVSDEPAFAGVGLGDYAGTGGYVTPIGTIWLDRAQPGYVYTFQDGTRFYAERVFSLVRGPVSCGGGVCQDSLQFRLAGRVTRAGFDDTTAVAIFTAQGSCLVEGDGCGWNRTASWSLSLSSPCDESGCESISGGSLEELLNAVKGVGPGKSLEDKIMLAQAYYAVPDQASTCAVLHAFTNEVKAQSGKKIDASLAATLLSDAEALMSEFGCD